jgi:S1-C subfamily serine protease
VYSNRTTSGTATIISYDQKRIVLLTCAHVVAFPDTVLKFYSDEEGHRTHFVKTCAIKERQTNYVGVLPEGGELEIIAMDPARDIALLGHRFIGEAPVQFPVFHYPLGKAGDLDWGSFVYIFGFPSGYRMITTGIVSNPNRDRNKTFFVDAVLSRGYSGGIAIAMRNGAPNFELVGMVKLVSGETQRSLVPPPTVDEEDYDPTVPYRGDIYVERETNIQYGVGQAVSVDAIRDFLKERLSKIQDKGYQIPQEWLGD